MPTLVVVHGSNGGGWVWKKPASPLRAAGHDVYAPTLTGLADRSHLQDCGVGLLTHIADVAKLMSYEDLSEVVLVGNSYAGVAPSTWPMSASSLRRWAGTESCCVRCST